MQFEDTASAAEAAADCAKKAVAAAQAAAYLASRDSKQFTQAFGISSKPDASNNHRGSAALPSSDNSTAPGNFHMSQSSYGSHYLSHEEKRPTHIESGNFHRRNSYNAPMNSDIKFDVCDYDEDNKMEGGPIGGKVLRRHSYNDPTVHSDVQWDESDCDEEIEVESPPGCTSLPPERTPPPVPSSLGKQGSSHRVHPKLPDYDDLAARFEALKYRK